MRHKPRKPESKSDKENGRQRQRSVGKNFDFFGCGWFAQDGKKPEEVVEPEPEKRKETELKRVKKGVRESACFREANLPRQEEEAADPISQRVLFYRFVGLIFYSWHFRRR